MSESLIPFNKPAFVPVENAYIQQALDSGHLSGMVYSRKNAAPGLSKGWG